MALKLDKNCKDSLLKKGKFKTKKAIVLTSLERY